MITTPTQLTQEKADLIAKHKDLLSHIGSSAFNELSNREQTIIQQQASLIRALIEVLEKRIKIAQRNSL